MLFVLAAFVLAACQPDEELPTELPTEPAGIPPATNTPQPETQPTPTITETAPSPTPEATEVFYVPGESIMGIEISGRKFDVQFAALTDAGAVWTRRNALRWALVEPTPGERNWAAAAALEEEFKRASEAGINLILIVRDTPAWAQKEAGIACGPAAPDKLEAMAAFMYDVVARYSQPPYNVKFYEIWNEPDVDVHSIKPTSVFGCWGDKSAPYYGGQYYAEMLKVVYPRVKAADPQSDVIIGGLLLDCDPNNPPELEAGKFKDCSSARFLEGILVNGGGDYFDGISFHAYDFYAAEAIPGGGGFGNLNWGSGWALNGLIPVVVPKARFIKNVLEQYGVTGKYLLNTETGLICGRDGSEPPCQSDEFVRSKAYHIAKSYAAALAEGLRANLWYSMFGWRASGLISKQDGTPNAAYTAYQFAASQFSEAVFQREVTELPGVIGYEFVRREATFWVLWSLKGDLIEVTLPDMPTASYDVFGTPLAAEKQFFVDAAPIYVEWTQ